MRIKVQEGVLRLLKWFGYSVAALVVLMGLFVGGLFLFDAIANSTTLASWHGERNARRDLSHGVYKEIVLGLPAPWVFEYQRAMKTRYDVDIVLGGCVVSDSSMAYTSAYNNVSINGIKHHFGHDVFKEIGDQAEAEEHRAHPNTAEDPTQ